MGEKNEEKKRPQRMRQLSRAREIMLLLRSDLLHSDFDGQWSSLYSSLRVKQFEGGVLIHSAKVFQVTVDAQVLQDTKKRHVQLGTVCFKQSRSSGNYNPRLNL